jgi:ribonuclease Z
VSFSVTILGSSSALPTSERFPTAHLLNANERFFLIDCGEGTQIQLRKYRIRLGKINHIFISHLHGDHIFGLFGLISSFNLIGREATLHIFGPDHIEELMLDHLKYFQNDLSFEIAIHKFQHRHPATIFKDTNIEVLTIPLKHRIPTCGFLFREQPIPRNIKKEMVEKYKIPIKEIVKIKGGKDFKTSEGQVIPNSELTLPPFRTRSYSYISDTAYSEEIIELIRNVDILYHETTFLQKDADLASETLHSTTREAAEIAVKAGARKLLIGHFSSRYKTYDSFEKEAQEVFLETTAVNDGDVFSVPHVREKETA